MLKNKLPKEINLLLSRTFDPKKGLWEIGEIMRELRIESETRERCITEQKAKKDHFHHPDDLPRGAEKLKDASELYIQPR